MKKNTNSVFEKPVYLGAATRTPIGKFGGSLKSFSAPQLATLALQEALKRAPGAPQPDFLFLGHARQAGAGPNPARQAAIFSGLSPQVPAITLNQACASGMASIFAAAEKIALSKAKFIWAGGTESMSNTPYFLMQARWGLKMGHSQVVDGMTRDGFYCPMADMLMGQTVETFLAQEMGISRAEQDAYALESQKRAEVSWTQGAFAPETFAIPLESKSKGVFHFCEDEHRKGDTTLESLVRLSPVFDRKNGTITAGNACGIADGAAFLCVSSERYPFSQAEILDYETVALDPRHMGLGPIQATKNILDRHGLVVEDLELVELNEAFAAQVIACNRTLKIPHEKLNPRGGAIALGHPIGATGARIVVTLLHQLKSKPGALGLATLCVSGGQGAALLVRSLS